MGCMKVHLILSNNDSFSNETSQRNAGSDLYDVGDRAIQYENNTYFSIRKLIIFFLKKKLID